MKLWSLIVFVLTAWGQAPVPPVPVTSPTMQQWRMKFFHDEDKSVISFRELIVPNPQTVSAFGMFSEDGNRPRGVLVQSRDGGKSWQTTKLPDVPVSADFIDAANGWLVTGDAVHRTSDGGVTWKRAAKLKGVLRVKFLTADRGFAVGYPKAVWSTTDGGTTWAKVPEAAQPETRPENTTYNTVTFLDAQRGIITGYSRPPQRTEARVPAWMDPEVEKSLTPSLTLVLETRDGGATWKAQTASVFGQTTKVVLGRVGLGLMEFTNGKFNFASQVVNVATSGTAFVDKERAVTDIALDGEGRGWVAGTTVMGTLNRLPIPSKVIVLHSGDFQHWYSTPVHYRAVANRVKIAFSGKSGWLATDSGMILALE
jgi:photosystem II stability/assembly factor-like uncharacterized protein